jgi:hypothetical protein
LIVTVDLRIFLTHSVAGGIDHCLVVTKVRGRLAVNKQTHISHEEVQLKKLNKV